MNQKHRIQFGIYSVAVLAVLITAGCGQQNAAWNTATGVPMAPSANPEIGVAIKAIKAVVPPAVMQGSGLAGAMGGLNLKAQQTGNYEVRLPLPQLADCQAPVCYHLAARPIEALAGCRLQEQSDGNVFVNLSLSVNHGQEVAIEWSAVVLIAAKPFLQNQARPETFRAASPCVQAEDPRVRELAGKLWPPAATGRSAAANIQEFIRKMERRNQPRSLDALGILESGQNTICTANANLACALMRAKGVACRSLATVPIMSRPLEMHRTVEFFDHDTWIPFDPSGVFLDISLKPWQNVIMLKTSLADELSSMKLRPGAMAGCPFGQEAEFARPGLNFFGQGFFWTVAVPLAEFEVTDEVATLTATLWRQYLKTGSLTAGQTKAGLARNVSQYLQALKTR